LNASQVSSFVLAGLLCASIALAEKPWPKDPSSEREQREIRQVLEHSPWAQRVPLMVVKPAGVAEFCPESGGNCPQDTTRQASYASTLGQRRGGARDPVDRIEDSKNLMKDPNVEDSSNKSEEAKGIAGVAVVRWASARTIRDALARMVPPSGKRMQAEDLAQLAPADAFVVYVDVRVALADAGRVPQNGVLTRHMARHSALVLKSTGQRIDAARVASAPLPEFDGRKELALAAYYIYFPKLKDGHPWLTARDAEVRFECPLLPVPFHADFKLSRMQLSGAPDL
jgi:hypothetical protein